MMCANFDQLKNEVVELDSAGIDIFHCDVMDGIFVPNIAMGLIDIKTIRKNTDRIIDVHLMIENPGQKLQWFFDAGADLIFIHPESERYISKTLLEIKSKGKLSGLAVNPDTTVDSLIEVLKYTDYLLIMTVNPGFAGQSFMESIDNKILRFLELKSKFGYKIILDGSMTPERIKFYSSLGCDGFVLGTSSLFGKNQTYTEIIDSLRKCN